MVLIVWRRVLEAFFLLCSMALLQLTTQWSQWFPRVTHSPLRTGPQKSSVVMNQASDGQTSARAGMRALLASATLTRLCHFVAFAHWQNFHLWVSMGSKYVVG